MLKMVMEYSPIDLGVKLPPGLIRADVSIGPYGGVYNG
jgi:hypothetical protein